MTGPPRCYTVVEVADSLRISVRTLRAFLKCHPFGAKAGRTTIFSVGDCERIYEAMQCPSSLNITRNGRSTGTSAAPSAASLSSRLRVLTTKNRRRDPNQTRGGTSRSFGLWPGRDSHIR